MKFTSLHFLGAAIALFLPCGSLLFGGDVEFSSETIVGGYERTVDNNDPKLVLPVYEYIGLDYGDTESGGLSWHFYGWIRKESTGSGYYEDDPDGALIYGYLQYAKPYSRFRINLGRQHIFSGITNESVDGFQLETGLGPSFSASVYGGLPVAFNSAESGSGHLTYGGRLAYHFKSAFELGLSYQNINADSETVQNTAGADLTLKVGPWLVLNGLSSYNLETQDWREHRFDASLAIGPLILEPSYHFFQYDDYFNVENVNNNTFTFLRESDETLTIVGADLLWQPADLLEIGIRGRNYTYDLRDESARYYAGLLTFNLLGGSQLGAEVGRMDGETSENIYMLYRGYFYWQNPLELSAAGFISGDIMYIAYDAPIYEVDNSFYGSLGGGHTFFDDRLKAKLSVTYSQDPYFDSDVGALMTIYIQF